MNARISTKIIITCAVFALFLNGCTSQPVTFNTQKGTATYADITLPVSARGCGFQLMFLIPIGVNNRQQRAYTQLLKKTHGGYIENIKVRESWRWRYIGTSYCTEFEATMHPKISLN